MGSGSILGHGGHADMPVISSRAYPRALADILNGYDSNGPSPEIAVAFNMTSAWYFGTDGNPSGSTVDFVSVALHELCHGFGFVGLIDIYWDLSSSNWFGSWGAYPAIYDSFAVNGSAQSLINGSLFPNPSNALYLQLTGNNVFFNGSNATAANNGSPAKLYAPYSWSEGSSYSHLDYYTYRLTQNALMVYMLPFGSSIHAPGPVALGILKDIGWSINSPCTYSLDSLGSPFDLKEGAGSVSVNTIPECSWTAASNNTWISVTSGSSGTGSDVVGYPVASYTGAGSRTGTMTIAGKTFTVTQSSCSYILTPDHQNFNYSGDAQTFTVTTNSSICPWSPSESLSWVAVNSGSGPGNHTVNYTVVSNPLASSRSGNMNIADKSFIITQSGAPPVADFSGSPISGTAPLKVSFTDTSTNSQLAGCGISATERQVRSKTRLIHSDQPVPIMYRLQLRTLMAPVLSQRTHTYP